MMIRLDKRENISPIQLEPNEGERTLLSSNKGGMRSPSLVSQDLLSDEMLLDQLASILVDGFLGIQNNDQ